MTEEDERRERLEVPGCHLEHNQGDRSQDGRTLGATWAYSHPQRGNPNQRLFPIRHLTSLGNTVIHQLYKTLYLPLGKPLGNSSKAPQTTASNVWSPVKWRNTLSNTLLSCCRRDPPLFFCTSTCETPKVCQTTGVTNIINAPFHVRAAESQSTCPTTNPTRSSVQRDWDLHGSMSLYRFFFTFSSRSPTLVG